MTATTPTPPSVPAAGATAAKPNVGKAIGTLFRMLLRSQLTKGKMIALGGLGILGVVIAVFLAAADDPELDRIGTEFVAFYGLALLVPLVSLLLASRALGNIIEDRLLVYLWLKPLPRWYMAAAAFLASLAVALPLAVIPTALSALLVGVSGLAFGAIVASVMASIAYCGLFTALGVRFSRGLWWGLLYILIWEFLLAGLSTTTERLTIRSYSFSSVNRNVDNVQLELANRAGWATIVIPIMVAVVSVAYAGYRLAKRDVE